MLGKLSSGLLQFAACLMSTLPIMILLCLIGGIDPRLVLLTHAGTVSVAFFAAGLSMLVSTSERRAVTAVRQTIGLAMVWCILPSMLQILVPRLSPRVWYWIRDFNEWWLASSPNNVAETLMRIGIGPRFFDSIVWMIGLQLAAGCAFVAWSVARLRRVSRKVEEQGRGKRGLARFWPKRPLRVFGRPSCGENPVLWKELHTSRAAGIVDVIGAIVALGVVELDRLRNISFRAPGLHRAVPARLWKWRAQPRRAELNRFLSHLSSWVEFLMLLIVAGVAAVTVTLERARDTWDSLIATPLDGREILRAKMIGAVWKVRAGAFLLLVLWSIGLLAGSVHPVGFGAAVVLLGVSMWFMAALGTFASLVSRDTAQASNRALVSGAVSVGLIPLVLRAEPVHDRFPGLGIDTVRQLVVPRFLGRDPRCDARRRDVQAARGYEYLLLRKRFERAGRLPRLGGGFGHRGDLFEPRCVQPIRPGCRSAAAGDESVRTSPQVVVTTSECADGRRWRLQRFSSCSFSARLSRRCASRDRSPLRWRRPIISTPNGVLTTWRPPASAIPDAKNGALRLSAAAHLLPAPWRSNGDARSPSRARPPRGDRQPGAGAAALRSIPPVSASVTRLCCTGAGRKRVVSPILSTGRFPVVWTKDGISSLLPHLTKIRDVANLLLADAILESEAGNANDSLKACLAILNAGRSIGDEPAMVSQRRRMELGERACRQIRAHACAG